MGTDKATFEVVLWGCATGSDVTESDVSHVNGSDVSHVNGSDVSNVTGSDHVRKYVLLMRNRKLRHILPSGAF